MVRPSQGMPLSELRFRPEVRHGRAYTGNADVRIQVSARGAVQLGTHGC